MVRRDRGQVAVPVRVAEHELTGLERCLVRVAAEDAGALHGRLADAVLEPELLAPVRGHVHVQRPDGGDAVQVAHGVLGQHDQRLHQGGVLGQRGHLVVGQGAGVVVDVGPGVSHVLVEQGDVPGGVEAAVGAFDGAEVV